jgi:predicted kinase
MEKGLGRPRDRWEDNMEMHRKVILCAGRKGVLDALAWGRNQRLALTNMAIKLWFPSNAGIF